MIPVSLDMRITFCYYFDLSAFGQHSRFRALQLYVIFGGNKVTPPPFHQSEGACAPMSLLGTPLKEYWLLPNYLIQDFDAECQITAQSSSCPFEWQEVLKGSHAVSLQFISTIGITHYHRIFFSNMEIHYFIEDPPGKICFLSQTLARFSFNMGFFSGSTKSPFSLVGPQHGQHSQRDFCQDHWQFLSWVPNAGIVVQLYNNNTKISPVT